MHIFIRDCQKVEELASKIYRSLAKNNSYPKELREVFAKLGTDEENHSRNLELLLHLPKEEISNFNFKISWDKVYSALRLAEKFLAQIDEEDLDQELALSMALEMEKNFMKVHAHNILEISNPRISSVFEELGKDDQAHCDTLSKYLEKCS